MTTDQEKIIAMLLGELDEEEHLALHETLLDSQNYEAFKIIQDQLIEDFLEDRLPTERKKRFEKVFLVTPARQSRLKLVQGLKEKQAIRARATNAWWIQLTRWFDLSQPKIRYAWGTAALVLVVILVASQRFKSPTDPGNPQLARQQPPTRVEVPTAPEPGVPEPAPQTGANPPATPSVPKPKGPKPSKPATPTQPAVEKPVEPVFAVTLLPLSLRSNEEEPAPMIPQQVKVVTLKLLLDPVASFPHYNVEILTPDGNAIYRANHLKPGGKAPAQTLTLRFPVSNLEDGDYRIQLNGLVKGTEEPASVYIFSLRKQK
ncbi:MAG TPA: hypothetical protein PLL06_20245 [Acidobacteriota bacterium]|nr:hypothetical protein [Acidobacteriota bacterium]HMZ82039.1 hypothetical protein [Acidobacteriota bacterium]HNG96288.1 hypothetical protein [Acidobacteriota bacterium]